MRRLLRVAGRVVGWGLVALVGVFLVLCTVGEVRQRVLVHRAKDLMVDIQALQDHKSTWADAQRLMTKWGKWGRYEGSCTVVDCMYVVGIEPKFFDPSSDWLREKLAEITYFRLSPRQFKGGLLRFDGMFLVQDGVVKRKGLGITTIPPFLVKGGPDVTWGWVLVEGVSESSQLPSTWVKRGSSVHPNYAVWRPGGCTGCMYGKATLAASSDDEFFHLTQFEFGCITGWSGCDTLQGLNPAARAWHLYDEPSFDATSEPGGTGAVRTGCAFPLYARGRDAAFVLIVEAERDSDAPTFPGDNPENTLTPVRVIASLSGASSFAVGQSFPLRTIAGMDEDEGSIVLMRKGERFLLVPRSPWVADNTLPVYDGAQSCDLQRWSAAAQQEILRGVSLRDPIRGPEPFFSIGGFSRPPER